MHRFCCRFPADREQVRSYALRQKRCPVRFTVFGQKLGFVSYQAVMAWM